LKRILWASVWMVLAGSGLAGASGFVFHNMRWNRHDEQTGYLQWVLFAARAEPRSESTYACQNLELQTYKLLEKESKPYAQKEMNLKADRGVYQHGVQQSTTDLKGNVRLELQSGREPAVITMDEAVVHSGWDKKRQVRWRTLRSESPVRVVSAGRVLTGLGTEANEESGDEEKQLVKSQVTILKDVKMVVPGDVKGDPFAALSAGKPAEASGAPSEPMVITAHGPLIFERMINQTTVENNVVVVRSGTRMTCRQLLLTFESGGVEARPEAERKGGMALKHMLARDKVVIRNAGQTFLGDSFDWDPRAAVGKLAGVPARMVTEDTTAHADVIEFEQKTNRIRFLGNAVVHIQLKPE
jgi:hypothetical protein